MTVHDLPARPVHERSLELAAVALDFELTPAETAELETHLASCAACARQAAAIRADARDLGRPLGLLPSARVDAAIAAEIARRRSQPSRLVLVAAAALLALALLGAAAVGAYLLRTSQTAPVTVVPPTTPVAIASLHPSPSPAVPPVPPGDSWQAIEFGPGPDGSIEDVTFDGANLVGVGRGSCVPVRAAPTQCYGASWKATTGEPFARAADQPGLEVGAAVGTSNPSAGIFGVASGTSGTVAIGYADDGRARVWHSIDGGTWQRATLDPGSPGAVARVGAITASPAGYVLVGWVVDADGTRARASAWTSTDGLIWTQAEDGPAMDVGECFETSEGPSCGGMVGVVATSSGFVAVGSDHLRAAGTEPGRPAAWTSPDGLHWVQSNVGLDFVGALSDVVVGGPGFVAVGTTCPPNCFERTANAVAATSVDGSSWTFRKVDGAVGPQHVASVGGRVFALGFLNRDVDPVGELQLWQTEDGVAWQRVTSLPSTTEYFGGASLAASDGRLVVVGWQSVTGVDGVQNFAYSSPPLTPPGRTADASESPSPTTGSVAPSVTDVVPTVASVPAPTGATGLAWSLGQTDANAFGNQLAYGPAGWMHVTSAVPSPPRLSIFLSTDLVTWSDVTPENSRIGCVSLAASRTTYLSLCEGLMRSSDGRTWQTVGAPPASEGTFKGEAKQFYSDGTTFLATTGGYPSSDVIWTSPDGEAWTAIHLPGAPRVIVDAVAGLASGGYLIAGRAADTEAEFDQARSTPIGQKNPGRQAMWASTDGATWTTIPLGRVFDAARITSLAADGPGGGIVAVGHAGDLERGRDCSDRHLAFPRPRHVAALHRPGVRPGRGERRGGPRDRRAGPLGRGRITSSDRRRRSSHDRSGHRGGFRGWDRLVVHRAHLGCRPDAIHDHTSDRCERTARGARRHADRFGHGRPLRSDLGEPMTSCRIRRAQCDESWQDIGHTPGMHSVSGRRVLEVDVG